MNLAERVLLQSADSYNTGLTVPSSAWMVGLLGKPGPLTTDCSDPYPEYEKYLEYGSVGPFRVRGHKAAVKSLRNVFLDVANSNQKYLLQGLHTAGMICVRKIRGGSSYSNHSFGMAIDLYYGDDVEPQGSKYAQRGIEELYHFFHKRDWFYGGGYKQANRKDSMHFEASKELILNWKNLGLLELDK